ncbi:MAG: hypothetical protein K1X81_02020 [Bacteroidia bacterium]|nr:hypothetical protein [Bacteroidia bacterium]
MSKDEMQQEVTRLETELKQVQERKREKHIPESTYVALVDKSNYLHGKIQSMQMAIAQKQ